MAPRRRSVFLVVVAASAILSSSRFPAPDAAPTSIASSLATHRSEDRAARATEPVRYDDTTLALLASHPVTLRVPAIPDTSADRSRDAHLWAVVEATLPDDAVGAIRQLNVVSDGRDGTLGMVHRSTVAPGSWVLSLDPAEPDDVLVDTLVHEYAHMLTLRTPDLGSNAASRNGCDGVRIEIGCARHGSALAAWHDRFWAGVAEPAPTDSRTFVSQYAASSVHEDLAESFMAWTLGDVARPSAGVRERFAFLESRPELVTARDTIRAALGD